MNASVALLLLLLAPPPRKRDGRGRRARFKTYKSVLGLYGRTPRESSRRVVNISNPSRTAISTHARRFSTRAGHRDLLSAPLKRNRPDAPLEPDGLPSWNRAHLGPRDRSCAVYAELGAPLEDELVAYAAEALLLPRTCGHAREF